MHYFHTGPVLHYTFNEGLEYGMYMDLLECYRDSFYPDIDIEYENFCDILGNPNTINSFYAIEGQIVSTATGITKKSIIHSGKYSMLIEDVCTKQKYRKNGYGRLVVENLLKYAKQANCYKVQLHASDKNTEFYRKLGFEIHNHHNMRIDLG